jgi:NAD(P)H dehydrogenase (quinone)
MNVLIVYAHMEPPSFNGALLDVARTTFEAGGHDVRVSDLYAMNFNPVPSAADFKDYESGSRLDYYAQQKQAFDAGSLADDISQEIEKVRWCDLMILQFPLYWFSMPAILKGWVDRVFVPGFAFGGGAWYDKGGLLGKRAMISTTMAAFPQMMAADGINGLLEVNLWPIQNGILAFCGFEVLPPFISNAVPYIAADKRADLLESYRARLISIESDTPINAHKRDDFDRGWKLKDDVVPRTVGHYFSGVDSDTLDKLRR